MRAAVTSRLGPGYGWALAALALASALLQSFGPLNHDVAWIVYSAGWLLDGAAYGRDLVEVQPPLPWWLAMLPVGIARLLGTPPGPTFVCFTIAYAVASLALTRAALTHAGSALAPSNGFFLFAATVLLFAPGYEFGQREHYLLVAALPYLAACEAAASGQRLPRGLAVAIGLFSAAGFCLKPHFLLLPAAAELWVLWRTRRLRIRAEALALAGFAIAYAAAIFVWAPDFVSGNLSDALGSYWTYSETPRRFATNFALAFAPLAVAAILLWWSAPQRRRGAAFLFVGAAAAIVVALLQFKGWPYHLLPGIGLVALACAALIPPAPWRQLTLAAALPLLAYGAFANTLPYLRLAFGPEPNVAERLAARIEAEGPHAPVFAFITSPRDVHPAVLAARADWVSPICCLHLIPAWVRANEKPERAAAARRAALGQIETILARLETRRPALIIVDNGARKLGYADRPFDYLVFFGGSARFRAVMQGYSEERPIGRFRIFRRNRAPD